MLTALIDADIVAYRNAAASEGDGLDIALVRVDRMMNNILQETKADSYKSFLSGDYNFRNDINPDYKANRKDVVRPQYLNACKEFLVTEWKSKVTDGYEADDALGFNQTENTIICTIDKDLKQVEGSHYNFVTQQKFRVSTIEGLKSVYKQALIGDNADNIKGISGIGPIKSSKLIDCLETELDMFTLVRDLYSDDTRFFMNMDCLWIWRTEYEKYTDREWIKNNADTTKKN